MYILDGALGTELEKLNSQLGSLWSGQVLIDNPELIKQIFINYIHHGANLITTATYQIPYHGIKREIPSITDKELHDIWNNAVLVAKQAIKDTQTSCKINGSIGPYGCYINDGSEYTGIYPSDVTVSDLIDHHAPLVKFMNGHCDVDIIGFETIPNIQELVAIMELSSQITKPFYISFCMNDQLSIDRINQVIGEYSPGQLVAVGVNCIDYGHVTRYLQMFSDSCSYPLVAYPNYGFISESEGYRVNEDQWEKSVDEWMKFNLWGLGGCCSTTAREIEIIKRKAGSPVLTTKKI